MNWANALAIAEKGFETWAAKDHNRKWVRKIDGTPIKNDLLVNIATAFAEAHAAEQVRAEREVCASIIDARCAEVLSRQYPDDPPPTEFEQSVNTN